MKVKAKITLLPTDKGGREIPFYTGVRPNHKFRELTDFCIGKIDFENVEILNPGESTTAVVTFIDWEPLEKIMKVGLEWDLNEGLKKVGVGKVTEIIEP